MSISEIEDRRSIRKFKALPVETEKLEAILQAALKAPSGKNKQPWKYVVLTGERKNEMVGVMLQGIEQIEKSLFGKKIVGLADAKNTAKIMKEAPVVIMVLDRFSKNLFKMMLPTDKIAATINALSIGASIQNLLLEAQALGLGTLWIGNTFFAYDSLMKWLNTKHSLVSAIAVGYPNQTPLPRPRKEFDEMITFY